MKLLRKSLTRNFSADLSLAQYHEMTDKSLELMVDILDILDDGRNDVDISLSVCQHYCIIRISALF
jgi:hypothetical protein